MKEYEVVDRAYPTRGRCLWIFEEKGIENDSKVANAISIYTWRSSEYTKVKTWMTIAYGEGSPGARYKSARAI